MIVVGMDVHVRNSFLHATDSDGRRLAHGRCANTPAGLSAFCERVTRMLDGELQPVHAVLESTTNSRAMQRLVRQTWQPWSQSVQVDVLDARKLRIIAESVTKCDALDARVLNELARSNLSLPTCYMPDDDEFTLRELLRGRADLVRLRTNVKNRIHAVLHRRLIAAPQGGVFTQDGRRFLEEVELDEAGRRLIDGYLAVLDELETRINDATQFLRQVMRRPRWARSGALLQTMPGIGPLVALTLLGELGDWHRFKSRAAVANYAGLVPVIRDSNSKHYAGGITHRGPSQLRAVLVQAAWAAIKRAPAYGDLFERVARRRGRQVAVIAVARRMLEDAFTMLKKNEAFRFVPAANSGRAGTTARDPQVASSVAG
jgi:transposase